MTPSRTARTRDFADEVEWGLSQEERILRRWVDCSPNADGSRGFIKGGDFDDFDFAVFDGSGLVHLYLEVKVRRTPFARFGDAIFPKRKRTFALRAKRERLTPVYGVTEYSCGTLVEVDLSEKPSKEGMIARRDRPEVGGVPHIFYAKEQLTVIAGPE